MVIYDQEGKFVGVRRPGSGKPILVDGVSILVDDLIGSSGLELKVWPLISTSRVTLESKPQNNVHNYSYASKYHHLPFTMRCLVWYYPLHCSPTQFLWERVFFFLFSLLCSHSMGVIADGSWCPRCLHWLRSFNAHHLHQLSLAFTSKWFFELDENSYMSLSFLVAMWTYITTGLK